MPSSIPNIDSLEGLGTDGSDEYSTLKKLQRHLEYAHFLVCSSSMLISAGIFNFRRNTSRTNKGMFCMASNDQLANDLQELKEGAGTSTGGD
jgi:hypothetical protein